MLWGDPVSDDDAIAAGMIDVVRRAVEDREVARKPPPQRPVEALDEGPEGDDRGQIGPRPALTITEAAQAAGVDRQTVRSGADRGRHRSPTGALRTSLRTQSP
jgi:hypothetical protein